MISKMNRIFYILLSLALMVTTSVSAVNVTFTIDESMKTPEGMTAAESNLSAIIGVR